MNNSWTDVKRSDSLKSKQKVNAEEMSSQANGVNMKVRTRCANYLPNELEVKRLLNNPKENLWK
jgi:hypothetical protein